MKPEGVQARYGGLPYREAWCNDLYKGKHSIKNVMYLLKLHSTESYQELVLKGTRIKIEMELTFLYRSEDSTYR